MRGITLGQRTVFQSNIWRGPRAHGAERLHNAAKPIDLFAWLIENSTEPGETVLDLFGGSGCTIMAAHRVGRVSYTMELNPVNADLIGYRWQRDTGDAPLLVSRIPDGGSDPVDLPEPIPHTFTRRGG